jgi:hypothetical protein
MPCPYVSQVKSEELRRVGVLCPRRALPLRALCIPTPAETKLDSIAEELLKRSKLLLVSSCRRHKGMRATEVVIAASVGELRHVAADTVLLIKRLIEAVDALTGPV